MTQKLTVNVTNYYHNKLLIKMDYKIPSRFFRSHEMVLESSFTDHKEKKTHPTVF